MNTLDVTLKHIYTFFAVMILTVSALFAQSKASVVFQQAEKVSIDRFKPLSKSCFLLPTHYAKSPINGKDNLHLPFGIQHIDSVLLVYTDFPKGADLDALNKKRFKSLFKLFPTGWDKDIKWKVVAQKGCETQKEAEKLFHGFAVYYKPDKVQFTQLTEEQKEQRKERIRKRFNRIVKSTMDIELGDDVSSSTVFERNKDNWSNFAIVSDWTGSMYKYTLQVLLWQVTERSQQNVNGYVFFNDGNFKDDKGKEIGNTGGIYMTENTSVYPVIDLMTKVKGKGDGGDIPENDIEALLFAQKSFPNAKSLVLIADNRSDIRDFELIKQIKKPVKIVLVKVKGGEEGLHDIHPQYLDLAIKTKGSIHTQDFDITDREEMEELLIDLVGITEK